MFSPYTLKSGVRPGAVTPRSHPGSGAEDRGFEPLRAVNPTRVPGERHRPLGEPSVGGGSGLEERPAPAARLTSTCGLRDGAPVGGYYTRNGPRAASILLTP